MDIKRMKRAIEQGRAAMVAVLKELRVSGQDVRVKLNASNRAIADEVKRLIKVFKGAIPKVSKWDVVGKLYSAIALPADAVKSIARAVKGAIALATKLGF